MKTHSSGDLARILLSVSFLGLLLIGSLWVLAPFLPATLWATTIVVTTWPWMIALQKRFRDRRTPAVLVMMTGLIVMVLIPLAIAFSTILTLVNEVHEWSKGIEEIKIPAPPHWLTDIPLVGESINSNWSRIAQQDPQELFKYVQPYLKNGGAFVVNSLGSLTMFFVHLSLTVAIAAILYYKGEKTLALVMGVAKKLSPSYGEDVVTLAGKSIKAVAIGIVGTAAAQSLLAGIGLFVANVPLAGVLSAAALVLTIVQVGPFIPLLVGVAWLYSKDQMTAAILLFIWTGIVGISDNIMRPMMISRGADLPFVLIFSGVIGGIFAFGIVGTFIGPVILAVAYDLLKSWIKESQARQQNTIQPESAL